jgi:hypothetical protein
MTKMIADLRQESYKQLQRIEALEAAQQPAPPAPEVAKLADRLDQIAAQLFSIGGWDDHSASVARAATLLRQLSAPAGVQRRYPSPATIAECGGPCDRQGPEACDCSLLQELNPPSPAPAGGLVKRVAHLLAMRFSESRPGTDCTPFACDVLREVAAAAEQMAPDKNLTWERVRLWLEVEAIR